MSKLSRKQSSGPNISFRLNQNIGNTPGGKDCFNFSAFSLSCTVKVYKYLLHRTLNFTDSSFFFIILTAEIK